MLVGFSADMSQHLTVSTCFTLPQQLHTSRNRSIALHHGSRVCSRGSAKPSMSAEVGWQGAVPKLSVFEEPVRQGF